MSVIHVTQCNAHLAGAVRLDTVQGSDGPVARATFIAISNPRRRHSGDGDTRADEPTAIRWTLWGRAAENAARFLGKGSHVNVVGSLRSDHYSAADGSPAQRLSFTADEVDYLDTQAEGEARRQRHAFVAEMDAAEAAGAANAKPASAHPSPKAGAHAARNPTPRRTA
jgi:single-stranded DNA-binding protein